MKLLPPVKFGLELPNRERIFRVLGAALDEVDPYQSVLRHMRRENDVLILNGQVHNLVNFDHIWLVGVGKASLAMARGVHDLLADRISGGVLICKHMELPEAVGFLPSIEIVVAGHPLPDENSVSGAQKLIRLLERAGEKDLVIAVISGGGSALMTLPRGNISLHDMQDLTRQMLACGARIEEINILRKHLDEVKGGGLARAASPAALVALVLSDVVGNPLEVIASGPTVPDTTTFKDARRILDHYDLYGSVASSIRMVIEDGCQGAIPETAKPGDRVFECVTNVIVGSNGQAARAAVTQAAVEGFNSLLLTTYMTGEAREAGRFAAGLLRQAALHGDPLPWPCCLVLGGETTVTLRGNGRGGRNQEMALGAVEILAGIENAALITLATDGEDGPTDAAGALVTGTTLARARQLGLDPNAALRNNDAYTFFDELGDLLRIGPTGTNVNDLCFLFTWP